MPQVLLWLENEQSFHHTLSKFIMEQIQELQRLHDLALTQGWQESQQHCWALDAHLYNFFLVRLSAETPRGLKLKATNGTNRCWCQKLPLAPNATYWLN